MRLVSTRGCLDRRYMSDIDWKRIKLVTRSNIERASAANLKYTIGSMLNRLLVDRLSLAWST